MKKLYLSVPVLLLLAACTPQPKTDLAAEEKVLRNLEEEWAVAYQNHDAEKILACVATDIVQLVPGNTPVIGIENYSKRVEAGFADTTYIWETYSLSIENVEISSSADLAYVWGTDLLKKKTPGGVVDDAVKWVDIWRKTDGNWKLVINTWNQ